MSTSISVLMMQDSYSPNLNEVRNMTDLCTHINGQKYSNLEDLLLLGNWKIINNNDDLPTIPHNWHKNYTLATFYFKNNGDVSHCSTESISKDFQMKKGRNRAPKQPSSRWK